MSTEPSHGLIEIHDSEIDPTQIMEQIREQIRRRREKLDDEQPVFPTFGATAYPEEPSNISYDPDLYFYLRLANDTYTEIKTEPELVSSPATRIPVIGYLWQLVREHVHKLVLFYVNRAVLHQVEVNRHLINILNRLTALSQEQQKEIRTLEEKLDQLCQQREE